MATSPTCRLGQRSRIPPLISRAGPTRRGGVVFRPAERQRVARKMAWTAGAIVVLLTACGGKAAAPHSPARADAPVRAPSASERKTLILATRAFIRSHPDCCTARRLIKFGCIRISTANSRWAVLVVSGVSKGLSVPLAVTLHYGGFTTSGLYAPHWRVDAFGSGDLNAPPKVMSDLAKSALRCVADLGRRRLT